MSGSKDKRERKQKREEGFDLRSPRDKQEEERNKRQKKGAIAFLCIFAVLAIAVLILNSKMIYRNGTALEINGQSYSVVEYNYYYNAAYQAEYSSGYAAYFIDTTKPLSSQTYYGDDSITWAEHFKESALTNMQRVQMLITEAQAAGMTQLDEDYQTQYDTALENLETTIADSDYSTKNGYLSATYGKGMNYDKFKELLKRGYLAQQYADSIEDEFEEGYSDNDVETKYEEIANDYDSFTYRLYTVTPATEETDADATTTDAAATTSDAETEDNTAAMAEAKVIAENIAAATSEEEFIQLVYDNVDEESKETYEDDSATLNEDVTGSNLSSTEYSEWIYDASRQAGDVGLIEGESAYYVIYFLDRDGHDGVELVNVRHILIPVEEEETTDDEAVSDTSEEEEVDGDALTEAETTALAKAEEVLAEWEDGDATEESFGVLADEYSEDSAVGGLYEDVTPGTMVTEFNDWIFDTSRKAGDVEIVKTENYGYHIIYFVGKTGETYRHYLGKTALLSEDYEAWETEKLESYSVTEKFFMRYAT